MDDSWDPVFSSSEYAYLPRNPSGFSYKEETNVAMKGNVHRSIWASFFFFHNNNNINTLYYSVKSSSKATQSSLIRDTDHNTGISLLLSTSVWVLLSPPTER